MAPFISPSKRVDHFDRDRAEYRRLLAEQITEGSRETDEDRRKFFRRLVRINVLYGRLY